MVPTGEAWPKDHCEIFNIIRIPLVIGFWILFTLATLVLNLFSLFVTGGIIQKVKQQISACTHVPYWESYWRIQEFKCRFKTVPMDYKEPASDPKSKGTFDPNQKCKIALKGHHGKYLCAEGNLSVTCNRGKALGWETFEVVPCGNNKIGLKSHHGKYLSAQPNGTMQGNRDNFNEWEKFTVQKQGNKWGFKSHHGKWLSALSNGSVQINRGALQAWELFDVFVLEGGAKPASTAGGDHSNNAKSDILPDGLYRIVASHSNKCLDVEGAKMTSGKIIQWDQHNGANQKFDLKRQADGYYSVQCKHSGLYWDISGASQKERALLLQYPQRDAVFPDHRLFKFVLHGGDKYYIMAKHSGKVLDIEGGGNNRGANIIQYSPHYGANQLFYLRPLDGDKLLLGNNNAKSFSSLINGHQKCKIVLKGHHGKYLCAEGNLSVTCNRGKALGWETFEVVPCGNNKIGLKSHHGKYLSAQPNGTLQGNRDNLNEWEQFTVQKQGNKFGFKSHHGKWLSAQSNGSIQINRDGLHAWELFEVTVTESSAVDNKVETIASAPTMSFDYDNVNDDVPPPAYDDGEGNDDYLPTYGAVSKGVNEGFSPGAPGATGGGNHVVIEMNDDSAFNVGQWLKGIGPSYFDDYNSVFVDNGFDSKISLQTLSDGDLQSIGVSKLGHRRAIMSKIEELKY